MMNTWLSCLQWLQSLLVSLISFFFWQNFSQKTFMSRRIFENNSQKYFLSNRETHLLGDGQVHITQFVRECAQSCQEKENSILTLRDLVGRSDPTSRNSFKGSIKFIPIPFLWNAQQAHALSMKIIFNLNDILLGKNYFFEQFLTYHL